MKSKSHFFKGLTRLLPTLIIAAGLMPQLGQANPCHQLFDSMGSSPRSPLIKTRTEARTENPVPPKDNEPTGIQWYTGGQEAINPFTGAQRTPGRDPFFPFTNQFGTMGEIGVQRSQLNRNRSVQMQMNEVIFQLENPFTRSMSPVDRLIATFAITGTPQGVRLAHILTLEDLPNHSFHGLKAHQIAWLATVLTGSRDLLPARNRLLDRMDILVAEIKKELNIGTGEGTREGRESGNRDRRDEIDDIIGPPDHRGGSDTIWQRAGIHPNEFLTHRQLRTVEQLTEKHFDQAFLDTIFQETRSSRRAFEDMANQHNPHFRANVHSNPIISSWWTLRSAAYNIYTLLPNFTRAAVRARNEIPSRNRIYSPDKAKALSEITRRDLDLFEFLLLEFYLATSREIQMELFTHPLRRGDLQKIKNNDLNLGEYKYNLREITREIEFNLFPQNGFRFGGTTRRNSFIDDIIGPDNPRQPGRNPEDPAQRRREHRQLIEYQRGQTATGEGLFKRALKKNSPELAELRGVAASFRIVEMYEFYVLAHLKTLYVLVGVARVDGQMPVGKIEASRQLIVSRKQAIEDLKKEQVDLQNRYEQKELSSLEKVTIRDRMDANRASLLAYQRDLARETETYHRQLLEIWQLYPFLAKWANLPNRKFGEYEITQAISLIPRELTPDARVMEQARKEYEKAYLTIPDLVVKASFKRWFFRSSILINLKLRDVEQMADQTFGKEWRNSTTFRELKKRTRGLLLRWLTIGLSGAGGLAFAVNRILDEVFGPDDEEGEEGADEGDNPHDIDFPDFDSPPRERNGSDDANGGDPFDDVLEEIHREVEARRDTFQIEQN